MSFRLDTPYYPLPGAESRATFGAVMEMLLKARLKLRLDTHQEFYDEDVNAYLAGVLVSYIDPAYLRAIHEILSVSNVDLYHLVEGAQTRVEVYRIYKVNADDLLVSLGLFHRLRSEDLQGVERLKWYYACAGEYQRRIYGKATAVSDIQSKLAGWTARYLSILTCVRVEYLHFLEETRPDQLVSELRRFEEELSLRVREDEFLDACSAWLKGERAPELTQKLKFLLQEMKELTPGFQAPAFLQEIF